MQSTKRRRAVSSRMRQPRQASRRMKRPQRCAAGCAMDDFMSKIPADREEWTLFVRNKYLAEENERLRKENDRLKSFNGHAAPDEREVNREGGWPDPEPLIEPHEKEQPYPLDALPSVISSAVTEYRDYGQQPLSLIASSGLAGASLASQGLIDVARD